MIRYTFLLLLLVGLTACMPAYQSKDPAFYDAPLAPDVTSLPTAEDAPKIPSDAVRDAEPSRNAEALSSPPKALPVSGAKIVEPDCSTAEKDKWEALGKFYRTRYISDLVFNASVDTEKIRHSLSLVEDSLSSGVLEESPVRASLSSQFNRTARGSDIELEFSAPKYHILNPESFYNSVITDDFLSYFTLKKKAGTWWVYADTSELVTWETYFWTAYFTEAGFEPELSSQLNLLVLGNFSTAEEALYFKDKFEGTTPLQVAFVVYNRYPVSSRPGIKTLELAGSTTNEEPKQQKASLSSLELLPLKK